jgi:putative endonuclease
VATPHWAGKGIHSAIWPKEKMLIWYEYHDDIRGAIQREHNMKHWPRAWKVRLILAMNPDWKDLYDTLV